MELLERAFQPGKLGKVPEVVAQRLLGAIPRDIEELLPYLQKRGLEAQADAEARLADRGRRESEEIRRILEDQRRRVQGELGKPLPAQLLLEFDEAEKRQFALNRRYWERWLEKVARDLQSEPARILDFYKVASCRIEPVGLAYLWPISG